MGRKSPNFIICPLLGFLLLSNSSILQLAQFHSADSYKYFGALLFLVDLV